MVVEVGLTEAEPSGVEVPVGNLELSHPIPRSPVTLIWLGADRVQKGHLG